MKQVFRLAVVGLVLCVSAMAQAPQTPAAQPSAQTDVYRVHFDKAALGKAAELGNSLSAGDPKAPMPGHFIILRHQEGDDWDYCVIEHMGKTATVDTTPSSMTPAMRDLSAWHGDTYVSGPSWPDFTKAMGIDQGAKAEGAVYLVGVFRPAPGHRDQVQQLLSGPPTTKVTQASVVMQHLEGGPWTFLSVTRYNSWQDLATDRGAPANAAGWNQTREHVSYHHDTIADRIAPK